MEWKTGSNSADDMSVGEQTVEVKEQIVVVQEENREENQDSEMYKRERRIDQQTDKEEQIKVTV